MNRVGYEGGRACHNQILVSYEEKIYLSWFSICFQAVINSTVTPNMTFTKTSQKFGQWSDVRANTVYGLGFSSEAELNKVRLSLVRPFRQVWRWA